MQVSVVWTEAKDGIAQNFSAEFPRCFKNVLQFQSASSSFSALSVTRTKWLENIQQAKEGPMQDLLYA
jgi:hypothetical protein